MRLLLDTHAFLWWLDGNRRLSDPARRAIEDAANDIVVSAVSAWEITTKHRIGKLPRAGQGFEELAITVDDAERAGRLPGPHRDPFDRILIAQALVHDVAVVSLDWAFDRYGVNRIW